MSLPPKSWNNHTQLKWFLIQHICLDWAFGRQSTVTAICSDPVNDRDNHNDIIDSVGFCLWCEYVNQISSVSSNPPHSTVSSEVTMCSSHMTKELCSISHSLVYAFLYSPSSIFFFIHFVITSLAHVFIIFCLKISPLGVQQSVL